MNETGSPPEQGGVSTPQIPGIPSFEQAASSNEAVAADGFQATMRSVADLAFAPVMVARQGFDAAGAAVVVSEPVVTTKRVRRAYPEHGTLTPATVALSDYVLATDTIAGVANGSTMVSPKPVANWAMLARRTVGDTIELEVTGNHWFARAGRPFACVVFRVSDGVTTVQAIAAELVVSGHAGDQCPVQVYRAVLDISGLADGLIVANARVFPWIGGGEAVADSGEGGTGRAFGPRWFRKDVARAASPPVAYVASTGSDADGVVAVDAQTARAAPFLTVSGAMNGLVAAGAITGGIVDGCVVRVMDTVALGASATVRPQHIAAVTIERDPDVAKAAAVVQMPATWRPRIGVGTLQSPLTSAAILFRDVSVQRMGSFAFAGESGTPLEVMFSGGVAFDNGGFNAGLLSNSDIWFDGIAISNLGGGTALAPSTRELRMQRGIAADAAHGAIEAWNMLGCAFDRPGALSSGPRSASGTVIQFNRFYNPSATSAIMNVAATGDVSGYTFSGNLVEITHVTDSTPGLRCSSDGATGNAHHVLADNNSVTGRGTAGRVNWCYEDGAAARTSRFCRVSRSIVPNFYVKGDWFRGANEAGADASVRTGNWAVLYGVGHVANWTMFVDVNVIGSNQGPVFAGVGSIVGNSVTQRNDPGFVDYRGSPEAGSVQGVGGGDYSLRADSPVVGTIAARQEVFTYDLAGRRRERGGVGAFG